MNTAQSTAAAGPIKHAAGKVEIEFDGQKFLAPEFDFRDFKAAHDHLLQYRRMDMLRLAAAVHKEFPPDVAKAMCRDAWSQATAMRDLPADEVVSWLDSKDGLSFVIHTLIAKVAPNRYTLAEVEEKFGAMLDGELAKLRTAREQSAADSTAAN